MTSLETSEVDHRERAKDLAIALGVCLFVGVAHRVIGASVGASGTFIKYGIAAQQHLHGTLPEIRQMDLSPLYFELNIGLQRIFPGDGMALVPLAWLQRAAVSASAGLLYWITASRVSTGWALVCALVFAFEPHVMVYEYIYEPEVLLVFFLLACVAAAEWRTPGSSLVAGVCAAFAIASRPTFLMLFLVLGPLYYAWNGERGRRLALCSLAFVAPIVLCGVGLGVRAASITGDASSPVMNPGTVFFEGNHPLSRGTSAAYPPIVSSMIVAERASPDEAHVHYRDVARVELKRGVTIADVNSFWAGKAFRFLVDEPRRAIGAILEKGVRIFRDDRWHDVATADSLEVRLPSLKGSFAAICALGLLGLLLELPRAKRDLFFYSYVAVQVAVMLVFYVSARQQMVTIAPLVFFATAAVRRVRLGWVPALGVACFFVPVFAFLLGSSDAEKDHEHRTAGSLRAEGIATRIRNLGPSEPLVAHGDWVAELVASTSWLIHDVVPGNFSQEPDDIAMAAARVLRRKESRSFFDEFDLATLELEAGDLDAAKARFEALAATGRMPYRYAWQPSDPLFYLGRIAALQREVEAAIDFLERALENRPGDPFVLAELSVLRGELGDREKLERYYSGLDARLLIGEAYLIHGRVSEAIRELAALVKVQPTLHRALVPLAVAHGMRGEFDRGMEIYRTSLRLQSVPVIWSAGVTALVRGWAEGHGDDRAVALEAAQLLVFHGRFEAALGVLEDFDDVEDENFRVREMIEKIRAMQAQTKSPASA